MNKEEKPFYHHLQVFRAFAILNIIAAHAWVTLVMFGFNGQTPDHLKPLVAFSETLFHNGTLYFAIISGVLYSLVLRDYSWNRFYVGKIKNVVLPYIICSTIYTFLFMMVFSAPDQTPSTITDVLIALPDKIIAGSASGHMWYIPVLIVLFALTPLVKSIAEHPHAKYLVAICAILPFFISRQWPDNTWQNFVFFLCPYLLGVYMGLHYQQALALISKYKVVLWGIVIVTLPVLFNLYDTDAAKFFGVKLQESVGYLQKVAISLLALQWFNQREGNVSKPVVLIANYSFALYFVHAFFLGLVTFIILQSVDLSFSVVSVIGVGSIIYVIALLISLLFCFGIKKLFGKYSRMIIGS